MKYPDYKSLVLDWPAERVLRVTLSRGKVNAMDYDLHHDIAQIWRLIDRDPDVNAVIVTGAGKYFSAGGDFETDKRITHDYDLMISMMKDAREIVENMINCSKPIISAINGPAAGGGLAVAMSADVIIGAKSAKIVDAHTRLGVAAGDHAVLLWPLMCGLAKAKWYLMSCDPLSTEEAERIGLITKCVEDDELMDTAIRMATQLARGAPTGIRWTKQTINLWLKQAWPLFEASVAYENLGFFGPDLPEGMAAWEEKREPKFKPASPL